VPAAYTTMVLVNDTSRYSNPSQQTVTLGAATGGNDCEPGVGFADEPERLSPVDAADLQLRSRNGERDAHGGVIRRLPTGSINARAGKQEAPLHEQPDSMTRVTRGVVGWLAWASAALLLGGCGWGARNDEPEPAPPIPNVTGMEPRALYAMPGERIELEIRMTDADGKPFEPYAFEWWAQISRLEGGAGWSREDGRICDATPTVETPATGVRRLSFVAGQRGQCTLNIRGTTCGGLRDSPCIYTESAEFGPVFVNIMGGDTASVAPMQPSVTLVPGESRPVAAMPMRAPDRNGLVYPSGQPWTLTVPDPSVAIVDGSRRVKGVAPGSTVVEFRSGNALATIPLTVVEGAVSAPPDGRHRLEVIDFDGITDTGDIRGVPATLTVPIFPHKHRLALDPRGWPSGAFEVSAVGVRWHGMLHMEWSGSGFGIQQVGDYRDNYWQPQYAIDDEGTRFLALQTSVMQGLYMAVQKPGYEPGRWDFHPLPRRVDLNDGGSDAPLLQTDVQLEMDREKMSILKRPGSGAWLAYVVWLHDATDPLTPCIRLLRLATATPDAVEVQDIEELRFAEGAHGCDGTAVIKGYEVSNLLVMPPNPGQHLPRVLLLEQPLNVAYSYPRVYEATGGQWMRSDWPIDGLLEDGLSSTYRLPVEAAMPTPVPAGEASRLVWSMHFDESSDAFELASFGSPFDDGPYPVCFCDPGDPVELFAFYNDGSVWVGDGNLSPLLKFTRNGRLVRDRPELHAPLEGKTDEWVGMNRVWGWAADASRFFFLVNHSGSRLDLVTLTPPKMAHEGTADTEGARLGDLLTSQALALEPMELSDGTVMLQAGARFDIERRHELDSLSGLWRAAPPSAAGDGSTWTKVMQPQPLQVYESPRQFFAVDTQPGVIYGVVTKDFTALGELVESHDGGATWLNGRPLGGFVFKAVQVGKGLAFLTHQPVEGADGGRPTEVGTWFLPDMTAAQPAIVELGNRVPVPQNHYAEIQSRLNVLAASDGFIVIMALDGAAWRSGRLDLKRYDATGALVDSWVTDVREALELDVSTAVLLSGGAGSTPGLLMLRNEAKGPGLQYFAHSSFDLFRTESESTLPGHWEAPMKSVRLNDGSVALLGTWNVAPGLERAAWTVTGDGQSWSPLALLRPEGGFDQEIWGATATRDGRVLVILGDNQLMRAGGTGLDQVMDGIALRLSPP